MSKQRRAAFTLVELLVVIVIIAMLMALLLPAILGSQESARQAQCENNQRECARAIAAYSATKTRLPAERSQLATSGAPIIMNWVPPVLPELGEERLWNVYQDNAADGSFTAANVRVEVLVCPSDFTADGVDAPLSYVVNGGCQNAPDPLTKGGEFYDYPANGVFDDLFDSTPGERYSKLRGKRSTIDEVARADGTSTTIMLGENMNAATWIEAASGPVNDEASAAMIWQDRTDWPVRPDNLDDVDTLNVDYARPSADHRGSFVVAFCDGSVRSFTSQMNYQVYGRLLSRDGANAIVPGTGSPPTAGTGSPPENWQGYPVSADELKQ